MNRKQIFQPQNLGLFLTLILFNFSTTVFSQDDVIDYFYPPYSAIDNPDADGNLNPTPTMKSHNGYTTSGCAKASTAFLNKYRHKETWIPENTTAIKKIKVNYIIWQKSDGTGNWENTTAHKDRIQQIFSWASSKYSNIQLPSDPISGVSFIADSRIRIELEEIVFIPDDEAWGKGSGGGSDGTFLNNKLGSINSEYLESLNIHVTGGSYIGASGFANFPSYDFNFNSYVVTFDNEHDPAGDYAHAGHLAHEIGHNLGLDHTYGGARCSSSHIDYLSDVHGNGPCPHDGGWGCDPTSASNTCTNNLMGGTQQNRYISPMQMGIAHRTLSITNMSKYVQDCPLGTEPLFVQTNEVWDFGMRLYQDVIIKDNANLLIDCQLFMSTDASICVYDGSSISGENNALDFCLESAFENININSDLYTRDGLNDDGTQPNTVTERMWTSPDVWIRQTNDGLTTQKSESAEYRNNNDPNYIYVRIKNKGCAPSGTNNKLHLYWAHASTGLSWPNSWKDNYGTSTFLIGDEITSDNGMTISTIESGDELILVIPWLVPNPAQFANTSDKNHFCLLSRIENLDAPQNGMATLEGSNVNTNTKNNNNIAWRNIQIVDEKQNYPPFRPNYAEGNVKIRNPKEVNSNTKFRFLATDDILDKADVYVNLGETVFAQWVAGFQQGAGVQLATTNIDLSGSGGPDPDDLVNSTTNTRVTTIKINSSDAWIQNIDLTPEQENKFEFTFVFKNSPVVQPESFSYHLYQYAGQNELIGGETFEIHRNTCSKPIISQNGSILTVTTPSYNNVQGYVWFLNGEEIPDENYQFIVVEDEPGIYTVKVIYDDCESTSEVFSYDINTNKRVIIEDVSSSSLDLTLDLYPNPVNDVLTLSVNQFTDSNYNVEIVDLKGIVLYSNYFETSEKNNTLNINTDALSNGIYMLKLYNESTSKVTKFIVNKSYHE